MEIFGFLSKLQGKLEKKKSHLNRFVAHKAASIFFLSATV